MQFELVHFLKGTPNKPSSLQVSNIDTRQFTVTWTAPDFDGGYHVTGYKVEYKEVSKINWQQLNLDIASATFVIVTGLKEGTDYEVRVAAVNSVGAGPFSQMMEACKTLGKCPFQLVGCQTNLRRQNWVHFAHRL